MRSFFFLPVVTAFLFFMGCSHTTIFEKDDGSFSLVTNAATESHAVSAANDEAREHCEKLSKRMVVVNQSSSYHGADKTAKAVIGVVSMIGNKNGAYHDGSTTDDYKVDMNFKCK
jgi:hypothetical protein